MIPVEWFLENGCELGRMVIPIYHIENSDPCRRCNCKDTCPAWPKLPMAISPIGVRSGGPRCPKCQSLLNMVKVIRRGGKCSCGQEIAK